MGILDEAIREHLDLRRRHGADDGELKQLEDEAFGPPSRPGEPDFPDKGEESSAAVLADAPPTGAESEAPTELVSPEKASGPDTPAGAPEAAGPAVEEAAPEESPILPPAPEDVTPAEEKPPADEAESAFFDQDAGELDLDELDLEIEDEPVPEPDDEPAPEAEPEADTAEPPVESLETVEHDVEQHMPPPPPPPTEDPVPEEEAPEAPAEGGAEEDEDSDVLEETPEFLQDRPEDDELWFEQGKPKDFDF